MKKNGIHYRLYLDNGNGKYFVLLTDSFVLVRNCNSCLKKVEEFKVIITKKELLTLFVSFILGVRSEQDVFVKLINSQSKEVVISFVKMA